MEAKMRRNIPRYDKELYRWMRKNLADKRRQKANDND